MIFIQLMLFSLLFHNGSSPGNGSYLKQAHTQPVSMTQTPPGILPSSSPRPWSAHVAAYSVFDSNIDHDQDGPESAGAIGGAGIHYRSSKSKPYVQFDYEIADHAYTNTSKWDRLSHHFEAVTKRRLSSKWDMETSGEISMKGSTEDRELANVYNVSQDFEFGISDASQLEVYGTLQFRRYDTDPGKNSTNPYAGIEFKQMLSGDRYYKLALRAEMNQTQDPENSYKRISCGVEYSAPLSSRLRWQIGGRYRPRWYDAQIVEAGNGRFLRIDHQWIAYSTWDYTLAAHLNLQAQYRFEQRLSNKPSKDFNAHLIGLGIISRW